MRILVVHAVDAVGAAVGGDIDLAADDGLDPRRLAGLEEGDRAVHDAVICEGDGGLSQFPDAGRQPVRPARAVEQAVFAVNM